MALAALVDEAKCNRTISYCLFCLIQFKFQIKFKLLKFVET
jgi:hypothetical protein